MWRGRKTILLVTARSVKDGRRNMVGGDVYCWANKYNDGEKVKAKTIMLLIIARKLKARM